MSRPRIRTVKPEMWQSEAVGHLSLPGRLLFVGLITMADDEGRLRALPAAVIGHVFPYDDVSITKLRRWLAELVEAKLIVEYVAAGTPYIALPTWDQHQKINRPTPSKLPTPPGVLSDVSLNARGECTERSSPHAGARVGADRIGSGTENPPIPPRGKRTRDQLAYERDLQAYALQVFGDTSSGVTCVKQAVHYGKARDTAAVVAFAREHFPDLAVVA